MDELTLWCYVQGDPRYFPVSIPSSQTIHELKERIYDKKHNFFSGRGHDAADLDLTKVCYIMISM
jgi:hypothetical protein